MSKVRRYVPGQKQHFIERQAVFDYRIPQFCSFSPNSACLSDEFRAYSHVWQVQVFPYGVDERNLEGCEDTEAQISVHLINKSNCDVFVRYTLCLLHPRDPKREYSWSDGPIVFGNVSSSDNMWGCDDFLPRSDVLQYLQNGSLHLRISIDIIELDELRVSERMSEAAMSQGDAVEEAALRGVQELKRMMPRMRLLTEDNSQQDRLVQLRIASAALSRAASTSSIRRISSNTAAAQEKLRQDSIRSMESARSSASRQLIRADSNGSMISRQVPTSTRAEAEEEK